MGYPACVPSMLAVVTANLTTMPPVVSSLLSVVLSFGRSADPGLRGIESVGLSLSEQGREGEGEQQQCERKLLHILQFFRSSGALVARSFWRPSNCPFQI
jgi:hypothetical protein